MPKRRWRIPPPLVQDGTGPGPEGLSVVGEIGGELGVVLWKSLRSVLLWAETAEADRGKLFDEDAVARRRGEILAVVPDEEQALGHSLEDLLAIMARPHDAEPAFVSGACARIASWAENRHAPLTQLEYLQAAALCSPSDSGFALAVGRSARDLARYSQAEAWFYRALGLARQVDEWETYVRAYLSHGTMMRRRGALPAARRSFLKGLRRSRRQGFREGEAMSLHDLCVLEWSVGRRPEALGYAGDAIQAYDSNHGGLPRLAHDVAYFWLEEGRYQHALPVFMATLGKVRRADRPVVLGSLGWAAAGVGDIKGYEWARRSLAESPSGPGVARAWVDFARAASILGRQDEAIESARLAEEAARERKEGQVRFLAESVLADVEKNDDPKTPVRGADDAQSDRLARQLIRALQGDRTGRRSRQRPGVREAATY